MNVRCNYCGNSFNLGKDYIVQAIADAKEKKQKYNAVECIKCRKTIKVPIKQMQRFAPKSVDNDNAEAAAG